MPLLERRIAALIGEPRSGGRHLAYIEDKQTHSPVLLFRYPTPEPDRRNYIRPNIRLEFGSLTDQRPLGEHPIVPWIAEEFPDNFSEPAGQVVALEAERTFWEKATILHAEFHRPRERPARARHSRDCYDLFALFRHPSGAAAIRDRELMHRVVSFKEKYFRSSWTNYETAVPGTFRVVPPEHRMADLRADYRQMEPMFFEPPPSFEELLEGLREIEAAINSL